MPKVGIVMGSDSDMPVMSKAADILEKLGIDYEMRIISAHREPDVFFDYAKTAEEKGFKVIIAGAGMAAHLPGMCAAISRCRLSEFLCTPLLWEEEIPFILSCRCRQESRLQQSLSTEAQTQDFWQLRYLQHQMRNFLQN